MGLMAFITCMQIQHLIGRGKYSQVYAAQHLISGETVALKKVSVIVHYTNAMRGGLDCGSVTYELACWIDHVGP